MRRLWGCYSVADHLEERAFAADLLLYDRLVIPTPAPDDLDRWKISWQPERQERLLDILGPYAERTEWTKELRKQFDDEYSPGAAALDVDDIAREPPKAYPTTRRIIAEQLRHTVIEAGDVRAVAVYVKPDGFDREWSLGGAFPFVRRETHVEPGEFREAGEPLPLEQHELAKVIVTRLVIPDDGKSDEDVLKRTVQLVSHDDIARRRAELHQLLGSIQPGTTSASTLAAEIEDLVKALNKAIRRRTKRQRARMGIQLLTLGESAVGLSAPLASLAAGPTAAVGEAFIQRRWGEPAGIGQGAVELLADAQRALR